MRKSLHNQAVTLVSFSLLAIIFGFIATAAFIFFKALFGSEVGIRKDLTAAFMGAFFAFLFVRIGEALTLIYKRKVLSRNAIVRLQHNFNDCLNVLNDNIFIIDSFFRVFAEYSASEVSRKVFANRFQMFPIERGLVADLNNLDFINEVFTLHVDFRKLNDSMETVDRMIQGSSEAMVAGKIDHNTYVDNIDLLIKPQMEELKKFLLATTNDIVEALASSELLLEDEPILSTISRLSTPVRYSSLHKKRLPAEVARIKKEIETVGLVSEERIRAVKSSSN